MNRGMAVLQTAALPLGYAAILFCKGALNRTGSVLPFAIPFYSLLKRASPSFYMAQRDQTITHLEQDTGFEPAPPVWKTGMLTVEH